MDNLYNQTNFKATNLFDTHFVNSKALFAHAFNSLPDIVDIAGIDGERAFDAIREKYSDRIIRIFQYRFFNCQKKEYAFDSTLILFDNRCVMEFDNSWCDILHDGSQQEFVDAATELISPFRERRKRQPHEINLVVNDGGDLKLKSMEIKRTSLDLELFYNEDFKETDGLIQKRLNQDRDKGIVLLHGLPGTGKTTYLRYLIGKIKKRVLLMSPAAAERLLSPGFLDLLIKNPNTVVIIEDAENIIMDRKIDSGSSVSNLLNISDGLLADCLNVQLICTFNSPLAMIDNALLRKGRLIAKYEFGKLTIGQAQRLSDHLGFDTKIVRPMTVAEIANQHEKEYEAAGPRAIGFRN